MSVQWVALTTYPSGFEADLVIERLAAAEIPAMRDNNDSVGIFGPGFQGATARGVTVLVPDVAFDEARILIEEAEEVVEYDDQEDKGPADVGPVDGAPPA